MSTWPTRFSRAPAEASLAEESAPAYGRCGLVVFRGRWVGSEQCFRCPGNPARRRLARGEAPGPLGLARRGGGRRSEKGRLLSHAKVGEPARSPAPREPQVPRTGRETFACES